MERAGVDVDEALVRGKGSVEEDGRGRGTMERFCSLVEAAR